MLFLEALLGYAVTKGADGALKKLRGDGLTGKLRATVEGWKADLPPEAKLEEPRALFAGTRRPTSSRGDSGHEDSASYEDGRAMSRLHAALEDSVPSREQWQDALAEQWQDALAEQWQDALAEQWQDALAEQWRRVRRHVSVEDAQPFFKLPEADAQAYLHDLAGRLAGTCAENEARFRRTVIALLRRSEALQRSEAAGRSGGTAQLLTDQTRYYIPDSDGNRYISKSPDGVPQDQCAYATLHVSVVFEAFSHWTVHECKLFLFSDSKDWHEATLFKGGERSWPLTGIGVRRYLTSCAEHAGRQSPPYNAARLSIEPGHSLKTYWSGWIMTSSSLRREAYYDALLTFHINTAYAAFVIRLHEVHEATLLGHRVFRGRGGFPREPVTRWGRGVLGGAPLGGPTVRYARAVLAGV